MVLEASYEATLCAAIVNTERTKNRTLFLTLLGGGAFGNEVEWIVHAIRRSLAMYRDCGLDKTLDSEVAIFSTGSGGFLRQRHYQQDWAANLMMQLMVDDLSAWRAHMPLNSVCSIGGSIEQLSE